jgi:Flp pilus assembly protein TadD
MCAGILGILTMLTSVQVGYWRTSTTLWEHAVAVTELNDHAHQHLAICYQREGRLNEAEFHLREAARIQWARQTRSSP